MVIKLIGGLCAAILFIVFTEATYGANSKSTKSKLEQSESYIPTIWVDPDGCQHWVMDDGAEGYMTPNVSRAGIPVCRRAKTCAILQTDQFFSSGRWSINKKNQDHLERFFKSTHAKVYIIDGHTDSDGKDKYNIILSKKRAIAVAAIASRAGAKAQARWYGERSPIASNRSVAGKAKNRRVEIKCVR